MSRLAPILVLTRPERRSEEFLAACCEAMGATVEALISPVMTIAPTGSVPDLMDVAGVILTSVSAVDALPDTVEAAGLPAYCVGARTAASAIARGFAARAADGGADALVQMIREADPPGRLLHLRGTHSVGDVAGRLTASGVPVDEAVIYDQVARPLSDAARRLLTAPDRRVILPLFSPRTARLLRVDVARVAPEVQPVALSRQIAFAWGGGGPAPRVADAPRTEEMVAAVVTELRADSAC